MISTSKSIAIPKACCWLAAFNSDFTVPLQRLNSLKLDRYIDLSKEANLHVYNL